jgi:hypothetical protein
MTIEKLLKDFGIHLVDGEWIKHSDSLKIIDVIRPEVTYLADVWGTITVS